MKLTILGSAAPYPRPDNACSGYLVQHGATSLWVDAGTGTLAELQRHIALADLDAIWISHSHADHAADLLTAYYALLAAPPVRSDPLVLIGPPGLLDRLVGFLGHRSATVLPEVFAISEMRGWEELQVGELALSWGPGDHGLPSFALRVDAGEHSIAYSGDSAYCEGLVEIASGVDLFLCEAGAADHPSAEPSVHCTPEDAARIAREAGVRKLILTHLDSAFTPAEAASRALAGFAEVHVAVSGAVFSL